jgi:DNA adenine methylase
MFQTSFLDPTERIVNVASAPQRSPFRYPGGRTWLIPHVRQWLLSLPAKPAELVEPFAGGAIVGVTVAAENLADHVTLVELDEQVAAVWQTIFADAGGGAWLAERIVGFDLTAGNVQSTLDTPATSHRERAFQTILRNRVSRGGILAPGAGLVKHGEAGKGLRSRWYPETLCRRILDLVALRDKVTFVLGDGLVALADHAARPDRVFFIDPPYTAAGKKAGSRLYTHSSLDHVALFRVAATAAGEFLMTYDDAPDIRELAHRHGMTCKTVAMKNTHHAKMNELLIGRTLDWIEPQFHSLAP